MFPTSFESLSTDLEQCSSDPRGMSTETSIRSFRSCAVSTLRLAFFALLAASCSGTAQPSELDPSDTSDTQSSGPNGQAPNPSPTDGNPEPSPGTGGPLSPHNPASPPGVSPTSPIPTNPADCTEPNVSESALRRLSRVEYAFTLKELFGLNKAPNVDSVPMDSDFKGFRTLAALQNVTTEHLRAYQSVGERLATELLQDAPRRDTIVGCELEASTCLSSFVANFGRLAYRRSLSEDEVAAYLKLADEVGGTPEEQFTTIVSAMLSSANFLFRVEVGDQPHADEPSKLTGEELASRLSFALIGRGPSKSLLDKGKSGALDTPEGLLTEAHALLADERAVEFFDAFFQQWLGFEQLRRPKQPESWWNDALMVSMKEETQDFLRDYAWSEGVNFFDSLTANHSFVRADLAEFYSLPAPAANGYVEIPEGHDRAHSGFLTHAAILSAKRDGDRIAHRGAWVQSTFLCIDLQLPTALLDAVSDELEGLTFNQIFEKRNTDPACANCHALIDPIGVGLAAYDEAGRFTPDFDPSEFSIGARLPQADAEFSTAGELAALLRGRGELARCLTQKMFLYADGREARVEDACTVAQATEKFASDQYRFASLLEGLVTSPNFRIRRAPSGAAASEGEK